MDEVWEVSRKIDSGSGREEFGHEDEVIARGAGISHINIRSLSPSSLDHVVKKLLKNKKLTPPMAVTDKSYSESTTSNVSGQSASRL
jgi:hypothetical protein